MQGEARRRRRRREGRTAMEDAERLHSLKNLTTIVYALQAASFFFGITWIVAVVINYVKREEVAGTWRESHFRCQVRSFWFGLLWCGLGGLLLLGAGRRRDAPERDVTHGLDLVVVVEHHPLMACDAEVLEQHVAGKDPGAGELLDGVAVLAQRGAQPRLVAVAAQLLDVDVERLHAPLDVDMADDQLAAVPRGI